MDPSQISIEALEKCLTACETKDLGQFKNQVQESFHQLVGLDAADLLNETIKLGWSEGAQYVLKQGVDPNEILWSSLPEHRPLIAMLELLAGFGMDYKSRNKHWNSLGYVKSLNYYVTWWEY